MEMSFLTMVVMLSGVLLRAQVAEARVATAGVVKGLDVLEYLGPDLIEFVETAVMQAFRFQ
jgi:hypothetical protein